jgi:GT2 family glycosyltransferase
MMDAQIAIIIVNWNGKEMLRECLAALRQQTFRDFTTVVVDNHSTDGSVEMLQREFPEILLLRNAENAGFAAAVNQGIRASHSEFVALLNNDAIPEAGWLESLYQVARQDERLGSVASLMLFYDRPEVINSTGILVDRTGIAWDRWGGAQKDLAISGDVFGACAGAALYRRKMLEETGLLDDIFFAYLDDVDLAWRAQWLGWPCVFTPAARVYHHHSASFKEGSPQKIRLLGRNKIWLIAKNYPMPYLAFMLPLIIVYDFVSAIKRLVTMGDLSAFIGRWQALAGLPRILAKRREIQKKRKVQPERIWRLLEPAEMPWNILRRYAHLQKNYKH